MSTRSNIMRKTRNGIEKIYCHWDGYLECNGKILFENYHDLKAVKKLIAKGNISSLKEDPKAIEGYGETARLESDDSPLGAGEEFIYLYDRGHWYYKALGDLRFFGFSDENDEVRFEEMDWRDLEADLREQNII